ncbi:MAG TPA: zinc-ribbon domain-containing protein [Candidatus Bathyarchaeia archaeon]|nr:zinc-ribbon domain-containing protein [Candidatus Bathyarchaeia archaeon]
MTLTPFIFPNVRAQSTSITSLQAPSVAIVGQPVTVTLSATYDLGSSGYAVSIGIFDYDASAWATGTASSTAASCLPTTHPDTAFCAYIPSTRSGSGTVTFQLTFSSVKTYRLRASVEIYYNNAQVIWDARTTQDFSIVVSQNPSSSTGGIIIYGSGGKGVPPDGAISFVTFTLQTLTPASEDLVTTFQVQGSISDAYSYTIDIKANPADAEPDYMITFNYSPIGAGPYFYDVNKNTTTLITNSIVNGNIWQTYVPYSWINDLANFWAGATTLQTVSWGIQFIDTAPGGPSGPLQYTEISLGSKTATFTTVQQPQATQTYTTPSASYTLNSTTESSPLQISTASSTLNATSAPSGINAWTFGIVSLVIIIFVAVWIIAGKKPIPPLQQQSPPQPKEPTKIAKQFCVNCGSTLPVGSKFCNKCGAQQP